MIKIKNVDMIHGNLFRSIIVYAIPIVFIGLVQSLFNAVDMVVLRCVADTVAIASVGATTSIIHLLINAFFGISAGAKVVLARYLGSGNDDETKKTVSTSMLTAVIIGIIAGILGFFLAPFFLNITNCPTECFDGALIYMRLYFISAPIMMIYNFGSAVLSVSGDSQRPLYYMLVSGVLNVALNFVLCFVMEEKVAAVAIATAVSQLLGAILVVLRLVRMSGVCRLDVKRLCWDNKAFGKIMFNGIPIGLSSALYPIANLQIQSAVNSYGPAVMAGNSAMANIEGIVGTVSNAAWGTTAGVFVGQNLGANNRKRVKQSILICLMTATVLGLIFGIGCTIFSRPLISLYVTDEAAIIAAQTRMMYTLLPHAIAAITGVLSNTLQAFGYSIICTGNSIVSVLLFRVFWMNVIYPIDQTFDMLCRCYIVSWLLVFTVNVVCVLYLYNFKLKRGVVKEV